MSYRSLQKGFWLAIFTLLVSTFGLQAASAISSVAPDPADYTAGGDVTLVISTEGPGNTLDAPVSDVIVYLRNPSGVIRINNGADQCGRPPDTFGSADTLYSFYRGRTPSSFIGSINSTSMNCGDYDVAVNGIPAVLVGTETYYPVFVRAALNDSYRGGANSFKVSIAAGGGLVSYYSGGDNRFAIQDRYTSGSFRSDFNLKFGTECSQKTDVIRNLIWKDDDAGTPLVGPGFRAELYEINPERTTRTMILSGSDFSYTGPGGDGSRSFIARANYKYEWVWYDISRTNGIQFSLPYDSIFYTVNCDVYELIPSTTAATTTAEPGQTDQIVFDYSMAKTGITPSDPNTYWMVKEFVAPPGRVVNTSPDYIDNQTTNCSNPFTGKAFCDGTSEDIRDVFAPVGINKFTASTTNMKSLRSIPESTVGNYPVGSQVCRFLAVDPATGSNVRGRWGRPSCVTIGKSPYLTIKNGDAWAGGTFAATDPTCAIGPTPSGFTARSGNYTEGTYGSYNEYANFSLGSISSFGSGGKPGAGVTSATLAFKRPGGGFYTSTTPASSLVSRCLQDANNFYNITSADSPFLGSTLAGRFGKLYKNGDLTLGSGPSLGLAPSQRTIIYVNGNLTINSNIIFDNALDLASLQSVAFIVSGNIVVKGSVTRLDGYYQARGSFITCEEAMATPTRVSTAACSNELVINGAVNVGKLIAKRNFGNVPGPNRNRAAETINMRPDVFLSNYGRASSGSQLRTISEIELPPRY